MEYVPSPVLSKNWKVEKIGVIGPGIVGMPMAVMLASARISIGSDEPAKVIVLQRDSLNSGWKVDSINKGKSVIGGIEPDLDKLTHEAVKNGLLSASNNYALLADADVILVCVQTDKNLFEPDYGPLFGALDKLCEALQNKPAGKVPLVIFESTLAPTTMDTLIREHFKKYGLVEGRDILLGNSPNRVMPGRLVERVVNSDKLAGGLHPETPKLISKLYRNIVTGGNVFETNSLTAEIVKTLENAYRDVRIAFSTEIVRYCDNNNIDFYSVREKVNSIISQQDEASSDPNAVPSGGILIPMLGVGGHCLPKDGILLWWRNIENGQNTDDSLILNSRIINDESPSLTFKQAESYFNDLKNSKVALLGAAYRFNSEDTRNSPTLALASYLRDLGINFMIQDPYVKKDDQNILRFDLQHYFTNNLDEALEDAEYIFMCTPHKMYLDEHVRIISNKSTRGLMDACNIFKSEISRRDLVYTGIGRGKNQPENEFVNFVIESFSAMERGIANELTGLIDFYNRNHAFDEYNKVKFSDVQQLAKTCSTGCEIADPGKVGEVPLYKGFSSRLVQCAYEQSKQREEQGAGT